MTSRFRSQRRGVRWRPGLDLVNLGLLALGAIVLRVLWEDGVLQSWLPPAWWSVLRWSVAALLALVFILDVVGGFHDLIDGVRRGEKGRIGRPPDRGPGGAAT